MKTLTIHVRNDGLVFDLPGAPENGNPRIGDRRWHRGWDSATFGDKLWPETALKYAPPCVLEDVLEHGVTEVKIISVFANSFSFAPSKLACQLYDAVLKVLSNPPEGTAAFRVVLRDVVNANNMPYYPVRADGIRGCSVFRRHKGPEANLQSIPRENPQIDLYAQAVDNLFPKRKVGKAPELAAGYEPTLQLRDLPALVCRADHEKLEARVVVLETSRRADWWAFRKSPGFHAQVWGGPKFSTDSSSPFTPSKSPDAADAMLLTMCGMPGKTFKRTHYWLDESTAVPLPEKPDYSAMVLRIGPTSIAGLCLPASAPWQGKLAEGGVYFFREVDDLAKKLRQLKVRELTLRRHGNAKMEKLTEWLVAVVNASSPVMKIISDPEMMK